MAYRLVVPVVTLQEAELEIITIVSIKCVAQRLENWDFALIRK
jgi:hypothetical protein